MEAGEVVSLFCTNETQISEGKDFKFTRMKNHKKGGHTLCLDFAFIYYSPSNYLLRAYYEPGVVLG
jgi:hypothetical protein